MCAEPGSPVTRDHASLTKRMFQFSESVLTSMMPSEKQSMAPMRPVVWLRNLSVSSFCIHQADPSEGLAP